ncbi:MAG: hypothetical protein II857_04055 [Selenomonadaceae bacterium]|nr:hypothetical protein [Selenomonadaceae bacterium]MBQ4403561.1 hypothetical protein [Selenomonadaceae bacterium]
MTEQERINAEVQTKLALQDAKFNMFMQEMRDRDNQRAEDIREIRMSIADMGKHVRNLSLTAMGAIGAMVVTVIISFLRN